VPDSFDCRVYIEVPTYEDGEQIPLSEIVPFLQKCLDAQARGELAELSLGVAFDGELSVDGVRLCPGPDLRFVR
jgi:hypothetical protein